MLQFISVDSWHFTQTRVVRFARNEKHYFFPSQLRIDMLNVLRWFIPAFRATLMAFLCLKSSQNFYLRLYCSKTSTLTSYKGTEGDMSLYCFMASLWRSMERHFAKLLFFKKIYRCAWTTLTSTGCNIQFLRHQSICLDGLRPQLHGYQGLLLYFSFE